VKQGGQISDLYGREREKERLEMVAGIWKPALGMDLMPARGMGSGVGGGGRGRMSACGLGDGFRSLW